MIDNTGFIFIHRTLQDHWIWNDANKLKWWLDILLTVNTEDKKSQIGNEFFLCKRGESLLSIDSWAKRWKISKDTARNFLVLLEKDAMVLRVSIGKSTRLTVCNYDTYQISLRVKPKKIHEDPTQLNNILSNDSNIDNRREVFKSELQPYLAQYGKEKLNAFYKYWTESNRSKTKMRFEFEKTWELNLRLANWKEKQPNFKQQKNYQTEYSDVSN